MAAERNLWAHREVGETGVVNCFGDRRFTAAPMVAAIESDSQPTVEIKGNAATDAAGVRFETAAYWEQSSRKLAVHIRAGMKEGVSAVELHLWRRPVLSCGGGGKHTEDSNHCRQHCQNPTGVAL